MVISLHLWSTALKIKGPVCTVRYFYIFNMADIEYNKQNNIIVSIITWKPESWCFCYLRFNLLLSTYVAGWVHHNEPFLQSSPEWMLPFVVFTCFTATVGRLSHQESKGETRPLRYNKLYLQFHLTILYLWLCKQGSLCTK